MNSFHKSFVVAILAITSYTHAYEYQYNYNHSGISHEEAHASAHLKETLVISQPDLKYSLFVKTSRLILKEAYARIGQKVEFEILPVARSLNLANTGVTDGELARMTGLQAMYPNLIQIPVPIVFNNVFVYSKNHNFTVEGWQSLKPYKIDYIFGYKFGEKNTKGFNTKRVNTMYQGLSKLNADRSDLYIGGLGVQCEINKHNFTNIKTLTPSVDELIMYHYLHKRHKDLAGKLQAMLVQMQKNGELESIQKQSKIDFLKQCL